MTALMCSPKLIPVILIIPTQYIPRHEIRCILHNDVFWTPIDGLLAPANEQHPSDKPIVQSLMVESKYFILSLNAIGVIAHRACHIVFFCMALPNKNHPSPFLDQTTSVRPSPNELLLSFQYDLTQKH